MTRGAHLPDHEIATVRHKARLDIIAAAYLELRPTPAGNHTGLCPFHIDATPSFQINPDFGLFHCFGCDTGGDVFTFLQTIEHLEFPDAVALAAHRIGHHLRHEGGGPSPRTHHGTRARLLAANTAAAEFYHHRLHTDPDASPAHHYLGERGFDTELVDTFTCGFAPTAWDALAKHLLRQGFSAPELEAAGLSRPGQRGPVDRFRARLIWPIRNTSGEVLGFGARRLFDDDRIQAKYLNTPETVLYKKSHVLFGIDHARTPIGHTNQAIVVEGYTDVMAMHAAGHTNTIAACGTAFGDHHLQHLRRILHDDSPWRAEIIYCFDGDTAGTAAATRALTHLETTNGRSTVATAPSGTDPCDLRQHHGDTALHHLLDSRTPLIDHALRTALAEHDPTTVEGKISAMRHGTTILAAIPDPITRDEYIRRLATWVGVEPDTDSPQPDTSTTSRSPDQQARPPEQDDRQWQARALRAALQQPHLATANGFNTLPPEVFDHPPFTRVHRAILDAGGTPETSAEAAAWLAGIISRLGPESSIATALALQSLPTPATETNAYLRTLFTLVVTQYLDRRARILRSHLESAALVHRPDVVRSLLTRLADIERQRDQLLDELSTAPRPRRDVKNSARPPATRVVRHASTGAETIHERRPRL